MSGPIFFFDIGVILAALIFVAKENADRRTVGFPFEDPGPNLRNIGLLTLRDDFGLAGTTAA